jgi:hypothetical protein
LRKGQAHLENGAFDRVFEIPITAPADFLGAQAADLPVLTHLSLLLVRVWSLGGSAFGSSRLHVVTSISSEKSVCSKVSRVPHCGQKLLVPFGVDLNRVGSPHTRRNWDRGTPNYVTNGAPVVRRQIEQWQFVSSKAVPAAS